MTVQQALTFALAVGLTGWFVSIQAGRLDRLHQSIALLQATLDGHLARRAAALAELSAHLDPASAAVAADVAHAALACDPADVLERVRVENQVTMTIDDILGDEVDVAHLRTIPAVAVLIDDLVTSSRRAAMSRRFHADAVQACRRIRRQRLVRLFHLAGHAPMPTTIDFADGLPATLDPVAGG